VKPPKTPNVILFMTDQLRADHLGCYGNAIVRTPAIDGLATRGTAFDRFYVTCPICMPNRIAMMTSRMPSLNGCRHNGIPLDRDAVTFVDLLAAGGYATALIGKSHLQNMAGNPAQPHIFRPDVAGRAPPAEIADASRRRLAGPDYEVELIPLWRADPGRRVPQPYYGFEHVRFANGHSDQVEGHYTQWLQDRHPEPDRLRGPANALPENRRRGPQVWRTAMPEALYPTTYIEEMTVDFITERASAKDDRPFFLWCSFPDPHHPFAPPGRYFDMYDPDAIPLPPSFGHVDPHEPELARRLRRELAAGRAKTDTPKPFACSAEDVRQCTALTYGMISMIDASIGRILGRLRSLGMEQDTVVIFTSDHGDFMGDHGLMLKHGLHYEGVIRVPFIWCDPATGETADRTSLGASTIDIGPTILGRAGLAPQNGSQGFDLMRYLRAKQEPPRFGLLIEEDELGSHLGSEEGLRTRTLIRDSWRLTLWEKMEGGELFDRARDPHELRNLWFDADYARIKAELIEAMLRETIRLSDTAPLAIHVA
jgi:arylsulfatase A-like enzyme